MLRPAKGLVQFLWLFLDLSVILQSYTELVVSEAVSRTFVVRATRAYPHNYTDDNATCDNSMIKQVQTGQFPSKLTLLPHKSKALASAIIFNNEIYHLVSHMGFNFFDILKQKYLWPS